MSEATPGTPAELYDYLQRTFGIGDWDEASSDLPWWQFRGREIAKLKSMLKKRRATVEQVVVAAEYARARHTPIRATYQIFALIPEAMQDRRRRARQVDGSKRDEAVAEAMAAGETGWADRLMRTSDAETAAVIEQWRNR